MSCLPLVFMKKIDVYSHQFFEKLEQVHICYFFVMLIFYNFWYWSWLVKKFRFFSFFVKIYGEKLTMSNLIKPILIFLLYTIIFYYKKIRKILNLHILVWKSQDTLKKAIVVSTDGIYHPIELKKNCPLWNSLSQTISQPNFFFVVILTS